MDEEGGDELRCASVSDALGVVGCSAALGAAAVWACTHLDARPAAVVLAVAAFHTLEFATTARNHRRVAAHAFLMSNPAYWLAFAGGWAESRGAPASVRVPAVARPAAAAVGAACVVLGQVLRTWAMLHAGRAFTHYVAQTRAPGHALVRTGPYAWMRHPSYAGFLLWAVGTQLLLGNALSPVAFLLVLAAFFRLRVRVEERRLREIFGPAYDAYARAVPFSGIL